MMTYDDVAAISTAAEGRAVALSLIKERDAMALEGIKAIVAKLSESKQNLAASLLDHIFAEAAQKAEVGG